MLIVMDEEVEQVLSVRESLPIVERALRALAVGSALSAARHNLASGFEGDREAVLKVWSAVLPDEGVAAVRVTPAVLNVEHHGGRAIGEPVASAPGNRYMGLILVMSVRTSELLGIVHDGYISQLGASVPAGIASKYLARADASVIGVLGAGTQARQQTEAVTAGRTVAEVRVFAPRLSDARRFAREMRDRFGLSVAAFSDPRRVVDGCDIVIAATSAPGSVFEADWVKPGTHVSVTRPSEVPGALFARRPRMFSAGSEPSVTLATGTAGALWRARQEVSARLGCLFGSLADLVSGTASGRSSTEEITLFGPFVGPVPGILWTAFANEAIHRAHAAGAGTSVPLDWFLQARPS